MPARGYLLALSQTQADAFRACRTTDARERWASALLAVGRPPQLAEVDKAWPAIQRCLAAAEGQDLAGALPAASPDGGPPPVALVASEAVARLASALEALDEPALRALFFATLRGPPDDDSAELDFLYTWQWFQRMRALYRAAAAERRAVLFTAGERRGAGASLGDGWTLAGASDPRRHLA